MYVNFAQALLLSLLIITTIYLGHQSKIRLLKTQEKSRLSRLQLSEAMGLINPMIENLKDTNLRLEQYNKAQRDKKLVCYQDESKYCTLCGKVDDCPLYQGLNNSKEERVVRDDIKHNI